MDATILILGGGVSGQVAANELRRLLPDQHRVVLVEKQMRHAFAPSFLWLMTGDRTPKQITRDVHRLLRPGIEVVDAEIRRIDTAGRSVETDNRRLSYDYLVVALGAELAPETIPGLTEAAHTFYTLDGATRLAAALPHVSHGNVAVVVSALPYKCPGAPHEAAMLLADHFRRHGLRDRVNVHLFTPEPQPMPVAGPDLGDAVKRMLSSRAVAFHPLHQLMAVRPDGRELLFQGHPPFKYDLLVAIPPHRAPALVRGAGLANEAGWVPVDRETLATRSERVYAVGDVTALGIPGRWKADVPLMLPKAGVFAHAQALVVARRIADEIAGVTPAARFDGAGYCMLEAGGHRAGMAYGDFFAEPAPNVRVRQIGWTWHAAKVLFEQWWLAPQGGRRAALAVALRLGSRLAGVPATL